MHSSVVYFLYDFVCYRYIQMVFCCLAFGVSDRYFVLNKLCEYFLLLLLVLNRLANPH